MKKNLLISMLVAMVALTSCSESSSEQDFSVGATEYVFNLSTGEEATRAGGTFLPERYVMAVFTADGQPANCFENYTTHRKTVGGKTISAMLQEGTTYDLVFWADDAKSFNTDDFAAVRLASKAKMNGNAYYAFSKFAASAGANATQNVILTRAVAVVEFFENIDASAAAGPKRTIDLTVQYLSRTFNAFTGVATEVAGDNIVYGKVTNNVDPEVKTRVGLFYIFAGAIAETVLKIGAGDNDLKDFPVNITANNPTRVNAKFYNTDVTPTFEVDTDWDSTDHIFDFVQ